jgi:hypothetical protein
MTMNDPGFRALDDDAVDEVLTAMAFVDVHPREVPLRTLLLALCEQYGDHHVVDEVRELASIAGIEVRGGIVILVDARPSDVLGDMLPPGYIRRTAEGYHGIFWSDCELPKWETPADAREALHVACERWGVNREELDCVSFPWGMSNFATTVRRPPYDPVRHAIELLELGHSAIRAAIAAGRLEMLGFEVVGIGGARWLFDADKEDG